MASIKNGMTTKQVTAALNELCNDRESWENGSYKQSNDALYNLLDKCLVLLVQIRGNRKLIGSLNELLSTRKLTFNNGTSLNTKIIRFVFGDCGKRTFTYASVLSVAAKEKKENESMISFISNRGGIEAVRRASKTGSMSKADNARLQAQAAEKFFATSTPLIPQFASTDSDLKPSPSVSHTFVTGLIRQNPDGTHSIVFACDNERIVKLLLAEAGKRRSLAEAKLMFAKQSSAHRDQRDVLVAQMSI